MEAERGHSSALAILEELEIGQRAAASKEVAEDLLPVRFGPCRSGRIGRACVERECIGIEFFEAENYVAANP